VPASLARESAAAIILSTMPPSESRWHRSRVPGGVAQRFEIPSMVVHDEEIDTSD